MPKQSLFAPLAAVALLGLLAAAPAFAWHVSGTVRCQETGVPISGITVEVVSTSGDAFSGSSDTDEDGEYFIMLPNEPQCFTVSLDLGAGDQAVTPASGKYDFCTTDTDYLIERNFVITGESCRNGFCWLTAGGAKFESIDKLYSGVNGPVLLVSLDALERPARHVGR